MLLRIENCFLPIFDDYFIHTFSCGNKVQDSQGMLNDDPNVESTLKFRLPVIMRPDTRFITYNAAGLDKMNTELFKV